MPGGGNRHAQVGGDLGEETDQHELGGGHGERADEEHIKDHRRTLKPDIDVRVKRCGSET
ncbi:hypothetical protein Vqi01_48480 [Micromonospora qiuiae]|uniref:Uncharacterized protein n=1 Tax=Micromonospora qiuiae TaxID=502268 RepID=A0ABQ4JGI7_9ACTN|nr:hypothetical protein Vqi01_48480 [Micromonospora qiuiae]